jgi:hypothetical protein
MTIDSQVLLSRLTEMENRLTARIVGLEGAVEKTAGVVEAWDTMKSGGKFVKWMAGVVASIGVLIAVVKVGILGYFPPRH